MSELIHDDPAKVKQAESPSVRHLEQKIRKERRRKSRFYVLRDLIVTVAAVGLLFGIILGIAVVDGDSMEPGLSNGNMVVFNRLAMAYEKNDIIIFQSPADREVLIKRVVAVAGDVVNIDISTGTLYINDAAQDNTKVSGKTYPRGGGPGYPYTVPAGTVFVLGDNRENALDSRDFGVIATKDIIGKVVFELKVMTH